MRSPHPKLDKRVTELFVASLDSLQFDDDIAAALARAKEAVRELEAFCANPKEPYSNAA